VRLVALVRQRPDLTLVPPAALRLMLDMADGSGLTAKSLPASKPPAGPHQPSAVSHQPSAISHKKGKYANAAPSWWVARARDAEVKPGFTKADVQRQAKEDPRAAGGVFERVGALLSELLDQG
jgi:hypothetical protein